VAALKRMASEHELDVKVYADGKYTVIGGLMPVHWWPDSKRMTAYVDGAPAGYPHCTAKNVISLALKGVRK
ncbi:MAG TPA: hypothetical protein VLJ58_21680, partial [Ramlibacter sp.]|nr:hypothetical protein [Ramlibacter sp.]